jgi:hypothetical protein
VADQIPAEQLHRGEQAARELVGWALDSGSPPDPIGDGLAIITAARDYLDRYLERAREEPDPDPR